MKRISLLFLLLVPFRPLFACDVPAGSAVATPATTTACSYLEGAIGLNEQSAYGALSTWNVGFGIITGSLNGAPLTLSGGFTTLPSEVDPVVAVPEIATDGTNFLLVEYSSGATYARLLHPDGSKGSRIQITNAVGSSGNSSGSAAVVWSGNEYLIAANDFVRDATGLFVPRITTAVVSRDGVLQSKGTGPNGQLLLTEVRVGSQALVVFKDVTSGAIQGSWFSASGAPTNLVAFSQIDSSAQRASSATNGNAICIAFVNNGALQVLTATASSPTISNINVQTLGTSVNDAAVVAEGSGFLVLYSDSSLAARATRISSSGGVGATFNVAQGDIVSAASNSRGTVFLSTYGCGTIHSQFIPTGSSSPANPVDVSLKGIVQTGEKLVPTTSGHTLVYTEGTALYAQSIGIDATAAARTQLSNSVQSFNLISTSNGGSAVAWIEGAARDVLKLARFNANGTQGAVVTIPLATQSVNIASLAEANGAILVAYQGVTTLTGGAMRPEAHGVVVSASNIVSQDAVLSGPADDISEITAGVDGGNWMIVWRNGRRGPLVVIETPQSDLRSQTRKELNVNATGTPEIGAAGGGNVYWYEIGADDQYVVHRTNINGGDSVLGVSEWQIIDLRLAASTPVWTVQQPTSVEIHTPSGLIGCYLMTLVGNETFDYDVRNGAISAFVHFDGTQLLIQNAGAFTPPPPAPSSRHRAVRH